MSAASHAKPRRRFRTGIPLRILTETASGPIFDDAAGFEHVEPACVEPTMNLTIRPFDHSDFDYQAWTQLTNLVWPDADATVEERRSANEIALPPLRRRWWMGEIEGQLVSIADTSHDLKKSRKDSFTLGVTVHPAMRCRGIGSRMYDHCLTQLDAEHASVRSIAVYTREDRPDAIRFLERRGFRRTLREPLTRLDLADFDAAPFMAKIESLRPLDVRIRTYEQWREERWYAGNKYYGLYANLMQETPPPETFSYPDFDIFNGRGRHHRVFDRSSIWVATLGEFWAGLTELWVHPSAPLKGQTGFTGVQQEIRRLGIATALKVRALTCARNRGWRTVQTRNEENSPMFGINRALGFKPLPAGLLFRLRR